MKSRKFFSGIAMILLLTYQSFANGTQPVTVDSKIEKVTVHRNGAFVTRKAEVNIPAGNGIFIVYGNALLIDQESARIRPMGDFDILSIHPQMGYLETSLESEEEMNLKTEKDALERILMESQLDKQVLEGELAFLNGDKLISKENKKLTSQEMTALMNFYRDRLKQISRSIMEAEKSIKVSSEKLVDVNLQLTKLRNSSRAVTQFVVETYSRTAMKSAIELSYWVQKASWKSFYDVRVKDINDPLVVQSNASVLNDTGEDWDDILLTLSTGNPWGSITKPTIETWWLGFRNQYSPLMEMGPDKDYIPRDMQQYSVDDEIEMAPPLPKTKVSETMTTIEFKISGSRTIPSNNSSNTIKLETNEIPASFHYEAIPSKSAVAFLTADIQHWRSFNFSYGEASLYFEGTYIGKTVLDPNQIKDLLTISFGPDLAVSVSRKKSKDFNERNWIGTKRTETNGYEFEIQNNKSIAVEVRVLDHIPVSTDESLVVELLAAKGAELNERNGLLTWQINLDPSQRAKRDFAYKVTYPTGKALAGGN